MSEQGQFHPKRIESGGTKRVSIKPEGDGTKMAPLKTGVIEALKELLNMLRTLS